MERVAIVAAGSAGNGAAIARSLAASGASVVVQHTGDAFGAADVVARIVRAGGRAVALQGDVHRDDEVQRIFEEALRVFGRPNIVVDEAGVAQFGPFWRAPRMCAGAV